MLIGLPSIIDVELCYIPFSCQFCLFICKPKVTLHSRHFAWRHRKRVCSSAPAPITHLANGIALKILAVVTQRNADVLQVQVPQVAPWPSLLWPWPSNRLRQETGLVKTPDLCFCFHAECHCGIYHWMSPPTLLCGLLHACCIISTGLLPVAANAALRL